MIPGLTGRIPFRRSQTDTAHAGISLPPDGGNPQHPIHDEDVEDLGPEDFEEMIDMDETVPVDKVIPK